MNFSIQSLEGRDPIPKQDKCHHYVARAYIADQCSPEIQTGHGVVLKPAHCTLPFGHEHRISHTLQIISMSRDGQVT